MHRNCGRFYRHWGNHTNCRPRENWGMVNPCERGVRVLQLKYRGGCAQSTFLSCSRMRQYVIKCCSSEMKRVCLELKCGKDFYTSILYTPQREPRKRLTALAKLMCTFDKVLNLQVDWVVWASIYTNLWCT